jgi:hypothetical protein
MQVTPATGPTIMCCQAVGWLIAFREKNGLVLLFEHACGELADLIGTAKRTLGSVLVEIGATVD